MSEHIPYNWDDEDMCFMDEDEEESEAYDVEVEREQIREINERNFTWEQERRLDWFVGAGLLFLLLAGFYFNKILAVWK